MSLTIGREYRAGPPSPEAPSSPVPWFVTHLSCAACPGERLTLATASYRDVDRWHETHDAHGLTREPVPVGCVD